MRQLTYREIKYELPPQMPEGGVFSLDLELSGLRENQLHRPAGRFLSLMGSPDGETVYACFDEEQIQAYMDRLKDCTIVYHNSVFDLGHTRRWAKVEERKTMRDTMLIERLMWSNYYDDFTLADVVRRYLKCYMPKTVRKEFINWEGPMTPEQIDYAAKDAVGTWLVDQEQQKIVSKTDMAIWNNLYNPHVWTTLELGGFPLDVDAWLALTEKNEVIVERIENELGQKYGHIDVKEKKTTKKYRLENNTDALTYKIETFVPFNPASPSQVLEILKKQGINVESTGDEVISPYREKNEFVDTILTFREAQKKVTTYGRNFLQYVEDGKIYTSLNISKAETGRDSSSAPNLQNIPSEKERRACFIAGEGFDLILYDYSGQEVNIWAYLTQDPIIKEILDSGKKFYLEIARLAFDEILDKESPRYKKIKSLVLGLFYGLSAHGFARNNKMEVEESQDMIDRVFDALPASAEYIKRMQSRNTGKSYSILGRTCHLHPYSREWKTNTLNNPMQASASDMIKLALKKFRKTDFYKKYYPDRKVEIILQVHDEIIVRAHKSISTECDVVLKRVMIEAAEAIHPGIKGGVSGGIIQNWSQKE